MGIFTDINADVRLVENYHYNGQQVDDENFEAIKEAMIARLMAAVGHKPAATAAKDDMEAATSPSELEAIMYKHIESLREADSVKIIKPVVEAVVLDTESAEDKQTAIEFAKDENIEIGNDEGSMVSFLIARDSLKASIFLNKLANIGVHFEEIVETVDPEDFMDDCPDCEGTGAKKQRGEGAVSTDEDCPTCKGEGYV